MRIMRIGEYYFIVVKYQKSKEKAKRKENGEIFFGKSNFSLRVAMGTETKYFSCGLTPIPTNPYKEDSSYAK